jgi:hypothetical protein
MQSTAIMPSVNSSSRRIALETHQRCLDAIVNGETEGAEFLVWWERLAGLNQGMAGHLYSPKSFTRKNSSALWQRMLPTSASSLADNISPRNTLASMSSKARNIYRRSVSRRTIIAAVP